VKNYDDLLKDPCTSKFVREVIRLAKDRDPVDVVNDLEALCEASKEENAIISNAAQSWFDSHVEVVGIGTTPDFADEFKQQLKQRMK
jgi:ATP-dependent protease HslVU (ClpYQ) peptidase subunit